MKLLQFVHALTPVALVAVVAGTALAAGAAPALADDYKIYCSGSAGGFKVCVSYDYTNGNVSTSAYNGNSSRSALYSTLVLTVNNKKVNSDTKYFYGQQWWGIYAYNGSAPSKACGILKTDASPIPIQAYCHGF
jgi:hypothetical protein